MSEQNYITIMEGRFNGVSYRIKDAKVVEKNGEHFFEFDYDAKGLDDKASPEFEEMLGKLILAALDEEIKRNGSE